MLVLRGEWLKAIGFPIGATAFLSTDQRGDITLRRLGVSVPRRLGIVKAKTQPPSERGQNRVGSATPRSRQIFRAR